MGHRFCFADEATEEEEEEEEEEQEECDELTGDCGGGRMAVMPAARGDPPASGRRALICKCDGVMLAFALSTAGSESE